jgi:hypothetical protein
MALWADCRIHYFCGELLKPALSFACTFAAILLTASSAHAECELGETVTTPVVFAGKDRVPVIVGTLNDHPFRFKLHSSDSATTLNRGPVEKLGLQVKQSTTNYPGVDVLSVFADNVIAGAVSRRGEIIVLDAQSDLYDGDVGGTMLLRNDLELAFADGYIKQSKPKGCYRSFLAAWDTKATVIPFTSHPQSADLRPWFWVSINGTQIKSTIGTDMPYTMIDAKTAARAGLTHDMPGARDDGEATGWRDKRHKVSAVPADVAIGGYRDVHATVHIFDMDLTGEAMVLGADFLRANRVLISMGQQKLYITPLKERMFDQ